MRRHRCRYRQHFADEAVEDIQPALGARLDRSGQCIAGDPLVVFGLKLAASGNTKTDDFRGRTIDFRLKLSLELSFGALPFQRDRVADVGRGLTDYLQCRSLLFEILRRGLREAAYEENSGCGGPESHRCYPFTGEFRKDRNVRFLSRPWRVDPAGVQMDGLFGARRRILIRRGCGRLPNRFVGASARWPRWVPRAAPKRKPACRTPLRAHQDR